MDHASRLSTAGVLVTLSLGLAACDVETSRVTESRPVAYQVGANWPYHGGDIGDKHFSPLKSINDGNIDRLGFAWDYHTDTTRGLEAPVIVVDGVLYGSLSWSKVFAVDGRSGEELWRYDPEVSGSWGRRACCDVVNRGVAVHDGKVFVGTIDGYLVALDAGTGREVWKADTLVDRTRSYTITGAPVVANGKIVIGNSGSELGVRGYITAYEAETGTLAWRFFTVPGNPALGFEHPELEMAAKTWSPDSDWESGLGGTVWDSMVYDPELDLLYVGVGNASPYPQKFRSPGGGDNLFLASILAIKAGTGRLAWYYQTTPGEQWDYTATQNMILAELEIEGESRKVLLQAPKNGFFYVLDRQTGDLLSAEKYCTVTWASHVDEETGRPVLTDNADYGSAPKYIFPSTYGCHNWPPMSFNPLTGLVYIPVIDIPMLIGADESYEFTPGARNNTGITADDPEDFPEIIANQPEPRQAGYLLAWDPVRQREVWRREHAFWFSGGTLSTAGNLVFQTLYSGHLAVYAADTGRELAKIYTGTSMFAPPVAYAIDGQQYVAVLAGWGGSTIAAEFTSDAAAYRHGNNGRLIAFKLGGTAVPTPPEVPTEQAFPIPPDVVAQEEDIVRGMHIYLTICSDCHVAGRGIVSDLRRMSHGTHEIFEDIVLDGLFESRGMASFADILSREDVHALHAAIAEYTRHSAAGTEKEFLAKIAESQGQERMGGSTHVIQTDERSAER